MTLCHHNYQALPACRWPASIGARLFLLGLLLPSPVWAAGIGVSPDCGRTGSSPTHFIVTVSGAIAAPSDSCFITKTIVLDGETIYSNSDRTTEATVDLASTPKCIACALAIGTHTLRFYTQTECPLTFPCYPGLCVETTFEVVASTDDPWVPAPRIIGNGRALSASFVPCSVCDIAPCDSIRIIQVVRPLALDPFGVSRSYSYTEQGFPDGPARDSMMVNGYRVDVPPKSDTPFYGGDPPVLPFEVPGSTVPYCAAAGFLDAPLRFPLNYATGVSKIVLEFETNVLCKAGEGAGHWLGRLEWRWERTLPGAHHVLVTAYNRNQPSAQFMDALAQFYHLTTSTLPKPKAPSGGGVPCIGTPCP